MISIHPVGAPLRLALAVAFFALTHVTPAGAEKASETINLECPRGDGSKWIVNIDLGAEEVRYKSVDSKGSSTGWQGPTWAMKHAGGWFSWYGETANPRSYWMLDRLGGRLEIETGTGGECCSAPPVKIKSAVMRCSPVESKSL